ncbi:hypothetical protein CGCSCA4_v002266 [Colletotrichum siamense]|uniref:Uncharacterized protein n=1 Tax=Colletotrichum siamense TaxID=690259 RepID=A0A9P5F2B0_COLSI|nr:hypothetical protein CGCSCA4_v002266 [Colletotrichum siamense]KAF4864171.1 hypothetical protein CGCSCA2_v002401 [Colletotrichum siamense]
MPPSNSTLLSDFQRRDNSQDRNRPTQLARLNLWHNEQSPPFTARLISGASIEQTASEVRIQLAQFDQIFKRVSK